MPHELQHEIARFSGGVEAVLSEELYPDNSLWKYIFDRRAGVMYLFRFDPGYPDAPEHKDIAFEIPVFFDRTFDDAGWLRVNRQWPSEKVTEYVERFRDIALARFQTPEAAEKFLDDYRVQLEQAHGEMAITVFSDVVATSLGYSEPNQEAREAFLDFLAATIPGFAVHHAPIMNTAANV
ncbi:hypothetical protein M1555_02125 [Patescibacteria group bacterium]|nr:hypothetical protein [Patescibacteria group bacterium]